nr:MAG TPA: hypothetical protein [Caudoviricetes sp.]
MQHIRMRKFLFRQRGKRCRKFLVDFLVLCGKLCVCLGVVYFFFNMRNQRFNNFHARHSLCDFRNHNGCIRHNSRHAGTDKRQRCRNIRRYRATIRLYSDNRREAEVYNISFRAAICSRFCAGYVYTVVLHLDFYISCRPGFYCIGVKMYHIIAGAI